MPDKLMPKDVLTNDSRSENIAITQAFIPEMRRIKRIHFVGRSSTRACGSSPLPWGER